MHIQPIYISSFEFHFGLKLLWSCHNTHFAIAYNALHSLPQKVAKKADCPSQCNQVVFQQGHCICCFSPQAMASNISKSLPFNIACTLLNKVSNFLTVMSFCWVVLGMVYSKCTPSSYSLCVISNTRFSPAFCIIILNFFHIKSMFCFECLYQCQNIPLHITFLFKKHLMHCHCNH